MKREVVEILKRCEVFLGLTDDELEKIATLTSCQERSYEAGEFILREGEEASDLYVLVEGRVRLTMKLTGGQGGKEEIVDRVTKGGVLGWSVLVAPHILTRSASCAVPCKVLSINGLELRQFLDKEPHIGYEVAKGLLDVIASRLMNTQRLLAVVNDRLMDTQRLLASGKE